MAQFAISSQKCVDYFRWTAVIIVVTKSFLRDIIIINHGNHLGVHFNAKQNVSALIASGRDMYVELIDCDGSEPFPKRPTGF